jgi:hypothetical protein
MGRQHSGRPTHVSPLFSYKYRGDEETRGEKKKKSAEQKEKRESRRKEEEEKERKKTERGREKK